MSRRTRIVATLGPATDRPGVLEQLLDLGLDVARINFSHGNADEHRGRIARLRELEKARGCCVAVMADLPGPKLRALLPSPLTLPTGGKATVARTPKAAADIHLTEPEALDRAQAGQRVLLDDGRLIAKITQVEGERLTIHFSKGGTLLPNKGVNFPDTELSIPGVTQRDREAIAVALAAGANWLALSFVRSPDAAEELRGVLREYGRSLPILAKIERPEAVRRAAEICKAFDGVMVARGDLGIEIPLEKVPLVQKSLIQQARLAAKPVITATDMLDSMQKSPRPTRAEASDVANAVFDGTDSVMLSGETAVGEFPVEAVTCMDAILREAEPFVADHHTTDLQIPLVDVVEHVSHTTCTLAHDVGATAIITPTVSGRTARLVARYRPRAKIIAVSRFENVVHELSLVWGVRGVHGIHAHETGEDRVAAAVKAAFQEKAVAAGDRVVVLAGHPIEGRPGFPTIRVCHVGEGGESMSA